MALESLEKGTLSTWGGDVKRWMPNVCGGTPILPPIAPFTIISFCKGFQIRNKKKTSCQGKQKLRIASMRSSGQTLTSNFLGIGLLFD